MDFACGAVTAIGLVAVGFWLLLSRGRSAAEEAGAAALDRERERDERLAADLAAIADHAAHARLLAQEQQQRNLEAKLTLLGIGFAKAVDLAPGAADDELAALVRAVARRNEVEVLAGLVSPALLDRLRRGGPPSEWPRLAANLAKGYGELWAWCIRTKREELLPRIERRIARGIPARRILRDLRAGTWPR